MLGPMTIFWWDTTGGWGPLKWENKGKKRKRLDSGNRWLRKQIKQTGVGESRFPECRYPRKKMEMMFSDVAHRIRRMNSWQWQSLGMGLW